MNVDRIRAARDRIVETARFEHVVARERVAPDDATRFADADLRAGRGDARARKAGNALPEERQQLHHLEASFDFGARQVVGIERIDFDDARHVDGHFVGIRRDEERDEFARNVDDAVAARRLPKIAQSRNRRQRARRSLPGRQRACASDRDDRERTRRGRRDRRGSTETSTWRAARVRARRPAASARRPPQRRKRRRSHRW